MSDEQRAFPKSLLFGLASVKAAVMAHVKIDQDYSDRLNTVLKCVLRDTDKELIKNFSG
jgi:hypothetical protein